ncbi:hypothetical protein RHSIM_Rhsim11G0125100 [Rhododendron simsii]|uniref:Uncharacterized protein n=1 Tax=Rhododendron simsii TaxID=118357 RepID=A0A834LBA9_RHOSS|nr:hypothetical protein RHSIM_Rhsim11G0125100 [Rhododendron simsii]
MGIKCCLMLNFPEVVAVEPIADGEIGLKLIKKHRQGYRGVDDRIQVDSIMLFGDMSGHSCLIRAQIESSHLTGLCRGIAIWVSVTRELQEKIISVAVIQLI